jgi:hypothetical protein
LGHAAVLTSETSEGVDGVECVVQSRRLLLPATAVAQVIEYDVVPLPLARPHVSGIGTWGDEFIVSIRISDANVRAERRSVRGAMLRAPCRGRTRCAIEVTRALSVVRALRNPNSAVGPWLTEAVSKDGRTLPWLDVDRMLFDLGLEGVE